MYLSTFRDALNSCEIYATLKKHKNTSSHFIDVFSWDRIPTKLAKNVFSFVFNLSDSNHVGTHWVSAYANGQYLELFDSYAIIRKNLINSRLEQLSKNLNLKIKVNKKRLQSLNSHVCGYYCIAHLIFKSKGYSLSSFVRLFSSNYIINDVAIKRHVMPLIERSTRLQNWCYQRYLFFFYYSY